MPAVVSQLRGRATAIPGYKEERDDVFGPSAASTLKTPPGGMNDERKSRQLFPAAMRCHVVLTERFADHGSRSRNDIPQFFYSFSRWHWTYDIRRAWLSDKRIRFFFSSRRLPNQNRDPINSFRCVCFFFFSTRRKPDKITHGKKKKSRYNIKLTEAFSMDEHTRIFIARARTFYSTTVVRMYTMYS